MAGMRIASKVPARSLYLGIVRGDRVVWSGQEYPRVSVWVAGTRGYVAAVLVLEGEPERLNRTFRDTWRRGLTQPF